MRSRTRCIRLVDPDAVVIKVTYGTREGRLQNLLWFEKEYPDAIYAALEAVQLGCTDVTVIRHREILHTHEQLLHDLQQVA